MDENHAATRPPSTRPTRASVWFAGGFLIVFVGALFFVKTFSLHPSGQAVMEVPLWHFYADNIYIYMNLIRRSLGPTMGVTGPIVVFAVHLVASVLGGGVAVALRWGIRKLRG